MQQPRIIPILLELLGGGVAGVVLGFLGGTLAGQLLPDGAAWPVGLVQALLVAALGLILGATLGIALVGRWFGQRGSVWLALAGASAVVPEDRTAALCTVSSRH